jgi:NADPH:quinone reductase-like Zn-dependent oxidoreductase
MFSMSALELHMRAEGHAQNHVVQLNAFGLNNFTLATRPLTRLEPGEIRIRVRATSLNFRDLLVARGQLVPHVSDITLPLIPLSDCAGEVIEVGSGVDRFEIGERVSPAPLPRWLTGPFNSKFARTNLGVTVDGVLGEYFTGDQRGFVKIPDALSFEEASTLPCAALTAWNALFEQGNVKPGQTVLVLGSGGVSIFALQFAIAAGARVIATTGDYAKLETLRRLGAAHVIDYERDPEWSRYVLEVTGGSGVDHVIETGGAGTLDQSIKSAATDGTISLIGMLTGATGTFDTLPILAKALRLQGIVLGSVEMFERMNGAIDSLGVKPLIDTTLKMQDIAIAAALAYLESGQHVGKVVIKL